MRGESVSISLETLSKQSYTHCISDTAFRFTVDATVQCFEFGKFENVAMVEFMVTPLTHVFFRAFFGFGFGLVAFYFLTWAILSSTVPELEAVLRFTGCSVLSGLGSVYFILMHRNSDVYLPKYQSMLFYSFMAWLSLVMGTVLFLHIESYQAISERMRLPTQILTIVIYLVFFVFSTIRISEARFLPSLTKTRVSDELVK